MDYNKIQTFVLVAELGSITEAARRLQRSQSAISQQVQALELELGLRLLERKAGKILLSADGEKLYLIAKNRLSEIGDEIHSLKKAKTTVEGHIRIGILDDYANQFEIGPVIARLCEKHRKLTVAVSFGTSASLEEDLIQNRIDIASLVFFTKAELFVRHPIDSTRHNLYGAKAYIKRQGNPRRYADILKAELLDLHEDFTTLTPWFKKNAPQLVASLRHRKPNATAPSHRTLKQMIETGFGMAVLPEYLVQSEEEIVPVFSSAKFITSGLDLAYRTNKTLRLCERLVVEELKTTRSKILKSLPTGDKI